MPHPRWALLSIAAACLTVTLNFAAYWLTGSVGLLSAAVESLVNILAAFVLFFALWYGGAPPDETHAFGHEKIEYFSGGFEGALILLAAVGIFASAIPRLLMPAPVEQLGPGLTLSLAAATVNLGVALLFLRVGQRARSLALESDGHHLLADVYTNVAVVAGLGVVALTGIHRLDPLIAIGVGLHVLYTGAGLVRRSFHGLMDRALEPEEIETLRAAILGQLGEGMTFHQLRTRRIGPRCQADVHVLVPGETSVRESHALATSIEQAVQRKVPQAEITVHIEPLEGDRGPGHLASDQLPVASGQKGN